MPEIIQEVLTSNNSISNLIRMPSPNFETQIHLRSAQSDGAVSVIELAASPDFAGPPLHHHDFDEAFYVLEGELVFQVEDAVIVKRAGEFAVAPRNVAHTFANHSDAPARYLLVITPASFERYFARMGEDVPEWALQPYPETTVVGPPIASAQ